MNKIEEVKCRLKNICDRFDIKINDINLYLQACTHMSYANEHQSNNYERLEFLGDAILDFLVGEYLYINYPSLPEGKLSKFRAQYVCQDANTIYTNELGLNDCLLLGKGEYDHGGNLKPSILGDIFESFLGAIYLDSGLDNVRKIMKKVVFPKIKYVDNDYKSRLQEYIQAESRKGVKYILEKETGPSHDKTFVFSVYHDDLKLGTGSGKNKKDAEQHAAKDALDKLIK